MNSEQQKDQWIVKIIEDLGMVKKLQKINQMINGILYKASCIITSYTPMMTNRMSPKKDEDYVLVFNTAGKKSWATKLLSRFYCF